MHSHMWTHSFKTLLLHLFMLIWHELTLSYSQWSQARRWRIPTAHKICFRICTGIVPENQEELKLNGTHHLLVYTDDIKTVGGNINTRNKTQEKNKCTLLSHHHNAKTKKKWKFWICGKFQIFQNTVFLLMQDDSNLRWPTKNKVSARKKHITIHFIYSIHKAWQILSLSSSSIGTTTLSWVSACSTVVEHSQQEGFYRVLLPAARQNHNLEDQGFRVFQLSPQEAPSV
jgi:hypothetical protein